MAVNIEAAAQVMENHAGNLDHEAAQFNATADQLMVTARQAAEQVMAEAKARADKILADAQASADKENGKADAKTEEADYWRNLAATERSKAPRDPVGDTAPDGQLDRTTALPLPPGGKPWTPEPTQNSEVAR